MDRYDIGEVLTRVSLEDVVRRLGIETERRGAQTRALCPFHQDTRPSLNLYPEDGTSPAHFHCFACGAHGTAIDLVKQVQGLEFLPAVQWLSQQFGLASLRRSTSLRDERKASSQTALDFALSTFNSNHDAKLFKDWCGERQFDDGFLFDHGLRCISRGVLIDALQNKSLGDRAELIDGLERLGLLKRMRSSTSTEHWKLGLPDQFRDFFHDGRIVIPIRSADGKQSDVVGFAGRALKNTPPEGVAKYLLTSGFDKSNHLFNANHAFAAVRQASKNGQPTKLYLVEGFLDALRMESLGQHAVALMGSSLGNGQMELLKSLVETLPGRGELAYSVFLDSDSAGFGGASRLVRRLLDLQGVDLRWTGLPWRTQPALGKDPDTCLSDAESPEQAASWLAQYDLPAEGVVLAGEIGTQDASDLDEVRWKDIAATIRERALFRTAMVLKRLYGHRSVEISTTRLEHSQRVWALQLADIFRGSTGSRRSSNVPGAFLEKKQPRAALARRLAYHGSRRGELPCDEDAWQILNSNEYLFDETALDRIRAVIAHGSWTQAAPFDAVHLPRKLTANREVLDDPRRKVMPHPADLHVQQILLNELLTHRHDHLSATGGAFSQHIPAVRWYSSRQEVVVTGKYESLNDPDLEKDEPKTLSFGYQVDMDVLEGDKTPSDQGMFRPFGQCWRDFMSCLSHQCHAIGPRVHVLRLDAKRYYDSIQRYVVREELLKPLFNALKDCKPEGFNEMLGLSDTSPADAELERLIIGLIFGNEYHDPDVEGEVQYSEAVVGIPQGPVLSAYIGTIALFPVDDVARRFIRRTRIENSDGTQHPRAGYARYVDDVVLFADSEALLKELREELQAKAAEFSIALIHKGEVVRSGTPSQVMSQLNDGRGLAASVPAWEPPIVGDGEVDWSLGDDLPKVDRQCALQMLRHPTLMDRPDDIGEQVKAAMSAPDLRVSDLGLCARWLWWHVAIEHQPGNRVDAWNYFWQLWEMVTEGHDWAAAFNQSGYDILAAVEGLDKLLDANPWQMNGQSLTERDDRKSKRVALARLVCERDFFERINPDKNSDHIRRRERLVVRKAWRLAGRHLEEDLVLPVVAPQENRDISAVEWLCLAGTMLFSASGVGNPLGSLEGRNLVRCGGMELAKRVVAKLKRQSDQFDDKQTVGLTVDFIVRSARREMKLRLLSNFSYLLADGQQRLIPNLPVLGKGVESLYGIDEVRESDGRFLYRWALSNDNSDDVPIKSHFLQVNSYGFVGISQVMFESTNVPSDTVSRSRSAKQYPWIDSNKDNLSIYGQRTSLAASLFRILLKIHQWRDTDGKGVYVPFRQQLFIDGESESLTIYLMADPIPIDLLGVSAWYHDRDERVQSENVPFSGAEIWRVGWAVADVLNVAADMAGEGSERDELIGETDESDDDARAREVLEDYVLRQQLRKLQGSYLSSASINVDENSDSQLPKTIERALRLLQEFPTNLNLDAQIRHVILMEVESRAMAMRINMRSGGELRHTLHQAFPDVLARLPLWVVSGLKLDRSADQANSLRPELSLMIGLYRSLYPIHANDETNSPSSLRTSLTLATVGIGLRGSVAALWGSAAGAGPHRMNESLTIPTVWADPDMARLDTQGDYRAIRKILFDGDWPALCRASPWQWMLAMVGLLDANFGQAFQLTFLKDLFFALCEWQTKPVIDDDLKLDIWPFESLPIFTAEQCDNLIRLLPEALRALDQKLGMRIVCVRGRVFDRNRDTDEFTDAAKERWQMSRPQYTSLYGNSVEECRPSETGRVFKVWTETRSIAENDLLAIHTLDAKLGKWLPSRSDEPHKNEEALQDRGQSFSVDQDERLPRAPLSSDHEGDSSAELDGDVVHQDEEIDKNQEFSDEKPDMAASLGAPDKQTRKNATLVDPGLLNEWQRTSWKNRHAAELNGKTGERISSHFRVALFQCRVDDSYAHPLSEVGLGGFPLASSSKDGIRSMLQDEDLKNINKAAKRNSEFLWKDGRNIISWPEHRRRVLLGQALKACGDLNVELLILPEVSVRPDTIVWLKKKLANYPGLAVLAGTYRKFEPYRDHDHLTEKLTLLWNSGKDLAASLGLSNAVIEFSRGKKYRAVAAHELFRPYSEKLHPLYSEESVLDAVRKAKGATKKNEWSVDEVLSVIKNLVHGPHKLRFCMELICSELFMLTSPANRMPLQQEMAKIMKVFEDDPAGAGALVSDDVDALGELLTFAQTQRERRSLLLVPAFTSRSNDYWHAGQASVLASGTATVFCNAANKKGSIGGSCFIGIDSVSDAKHEHAGVVRLLTPYHGWSKGILQPDCKGALSPADQALVVVDLDPVHVVGGKPRPQLLPEPMSLVAYLPIVEVVDKDKNAEGLKKELRGKLTDEGCEALGRMLTNEAFPEACGQLHEHKDFFEALDALLKDKRDEKLDLEIGGPKVEKFKEFFGDSRAVGERIMAWLRDRHQQPAPRAGDLRLEPAWLDFLVADLTWTYSGETRPEVHVPPWISEKKDF